MNARASNSRFYELITGEIYEEDLKSVFFVDPEKKSIKEFLISEKIIQGLHESEIVIERVIDDKNFKGISFGVDYEARAFGGSFDDNEDLPQNYSHLIQKFKNSFFTFNSQYPLEGPTIFGCFDRFGDVTFVKPSLDDFKKMITFRDDIERIYHFQLGILKPNMFSITIEDSKILQTVKDKYKKEIARANKDDQAKYFIRLNNSKLAFSSAEECLKTLKEIHHTDSIVLREKN